jgi:hypothetical protein
MALTRLVWVAKKDTHQGRKVANFLLAWTNARAYGGFDFTDIGGLDCDLRQHIRTVFNYLLDGGFRYPIQMGQEYENMMLEVIERQR